LGLKQFTISDVYFRDNFVIFVDTCLLLRSPMTSKTSASLGKALTCCKSAMKYPDLSSGQDEKNVFDEICDSHTETSSNEEPSGSASSKRKVSFQLCVCDGGKALSTITLKHVKTYRLVLTHPFILYTLGSVCCP